MKRIMTTLFCSAVMLSASAATDKVSVADTNRDGYINTADANLIYSYILGTAGEEVTAEQVDVNGDGEVNTIDVVKVYIEMNKGLNGGAPDSDDSEFGGAPERRGTWGNLWE